MASLQTMPFDVLFEVTRYLDFGSILALSTTDEALHASVGPMAMATDKAKRDFFLKVERYGRYKYPPKLTCFSCWRILPQDQFGDGMSKGPRGKWASGKHSYLARQRFCWTCGADKRLYRERNGLQNGIRKGKHVWYLCHRCGKYKLRSQRCGEPGEEVVQAAAAAAGEGDATITSLVVVSTCTTEPEPAKSRLEQLPETVQQRILALLPYRDSLMLAQASRQLRAQVRPLDCPLRSKVLFLHAHYQAGKRGRFRDSLPCFACFVVKPERKFTSEQRHHPSRALAFVDGLGVGRSNAGYVVRRCAACIRTMHEPTPAGRAALAEWRRRRVCQLCREIVYLDRPDSECEGCLARGDLQGKRESMHAARQWQRAQANAGGGGGDDGDDDDDALAALSPWVRGLEGCLARIDLWDQSERAHAREQAGSGHDGALAPLSSWGRAVEDCLVAVLERHSEEASGGDMDDDDDNTLGPWTEEANKGEHDEARQSWLTKLGAAAARASTLRKRRLGVAGGDDLPGPATASTMPPRTGKLRDLARRFRAFIAKSSS